jgi:hypothetical protein
MSARTIVIVLCLTTLAWIAATSLVYTYRRDWAGLRRFLFTWHRGMFGGPTVLLGVLVLGALVRTFV